MQPEYSFVIPVLDEIEIIDELTDRLAAVMDQMDGPCEAIIVDDGSTDGSFERLAELSELEPRLRVVRLSRNFGHQVAITAGLDRARGNAVIIMDGDLQDPPEVAVEMARRWREGAEVVFGVRRTREGESWMKRTTARWFYRGLSGASNVDVPVDAGDFRLVDRQALQAVNSMREQGRYLRGMFAWVGFEQEPVHYERAARTAGETKFSMRRMVSFAIDGLLSFSTAPLRLVIGIGFAVSAAAFLLGLIASAVWLGGTTIPGWTSLAVAVVFLGGVQLVVLGVIGAYVADIQQEVKRRPLYVVRDELRGPDADAP